MSDVALRIESLGKQYRIGKQEQYRTFRDTITDAATAPFRRIAGLLRGNASAAANLTETIWALKDVSFEVKHGEVVGIIGRNGAGKSTLLKILSRITEPTAGIVNVYGRVGALLEVGTGFHPELTGRENIYLNGAILGMSREEIKRKFDEIVDFSGVGKFIDTPVKHYSSGMGLRLGFAVAAHLEPEILIVDEVLAVGDAEFQKKCMGKMSEVAGEGRTVLLVSHNMTSIENMCTRSLILDVGRIVHDGNTREIIGHYQDMLQNRKHQPFSVRARHQGIGEIAITNVELLDVNGTSIGMAVSGQSLLIKVFFESVRSLEAIDFAVSLKTGTGMTLCRCTASQSGRSFDIPPGPGAITCRFDDLPLATGTYYINVAAFRGGVTYDWVEDACSLDVETYDYFGTGVAFPAGPSPVLIRSTWEASEPIEV